MRGYPGVEETRFDVLLREAAQQTTRRGALGALVGGALLLGNPGEGEATKRAQRRRQRKKRKQAASELLPIQVTVKNPGPSTLNVQFVNLIHAWSLPVRWICINPAQQQNIWPNNSATFYTRPVPGSPVGRRSTDGFVWINGKYAMEFWNLLFHTPSVSAAVNGVSMNHRRQCPNRGTRALKDTAISEGTTFTFKIYDKEYTVERLPDTDHKVFVLTLPENL